MNSAEPQHRAPLRTAVIGVGYLGRFHAQKYAQLPGVELVAVVDADAAAARKVAAELDVPALGDYRELSGRVDAVSLAVPTPLHHPIGRELLAAGVHLLVEKPITTTVAEARELIDIARQHKRVLQVGHLERFNPAVLAAVGRLRTPRFIETHRLAPTSSAAPMSAWCSIC